MSIPTTTAELNAAIAAMNKRTSPSLRAAQASAVRFVRKMSARPDIMALNEEAACRAIAHAWLQSLTNETAHALASHDHEDPCGGRAPDGERH